MKKLLFMVMLLCGSLNIFGQGVTLEEARKIYAESMENKTTCDAAYQRFNTVKNTGNPLLTGYKGAVSVAMSKHCKGTKDKITYFNQGKKLIESAILEDGQNAELRFIRFTIQTNVPAALKYNKEISSDKKFIIENLNTIKNTGVRTRIKDYLLKSEEVTAEEKQKINAL